jgi:hypothetical protein
MGDIRRSREFEEVVGARVPLARHEAVRLHHSSIEGKTVRVFKVLFLSTVIMAMSASVASAAIVETINPAAAPTGTHLQTGDIDCSVSATGVVTCTSYELAGVGNANATATLNATYTATVQCRNRGGQIVEVKSQTQAAPTTTGALRPKNGRLAVPELQSGPVPSNAAFEASATCPNGNWTKETLGSTVTLSSFTYTLHFTGFTGDYITITGP